MSFSDTSISSYIGLLLLHIEGLIKDYFEFLEKMLYGIILIPLQNTKVKGQIR